MFTGGPYPLRALHDFYETLTRSEVLVLRLAAQGLSNKQIASKIFKCVKQGEHDIAEILYKLKAVNMKHAINIVWEIGILKKKS